MNAMTLQRLGHRLYRSRIPVVPKIIEVLIFFMFNSYISVKAEVGQGSKCSYNGIGVVIHPRCRIGRNVTIGPNVTVGGRSRLPDVPVIEDEVFIATGAKVLGPIVIGKGSVIGANCVVIADVPPRSIVAGVPGRIIRSDVDWREFV